MTRTEIITNLFTGRNFNDCIGKFEPEHLREDLKMEIITIVCSWSEERVIGLHQRKELEFFVVRTILNQVKSNTSPFYRKYRTATQELNGTEIADCSDIEERQGRELMEDIALVELDKLERDEWTVPGHSSWYVHTLIKLYQEHGTFRKIQELTTIPYVSCYKTIKKALAEVRRRSIDPAARPVNQTQMIRG